MLNTLLPLDVLGPYQRIYGMFWIFLLYNYRINSDAKMEMDGLNTRRGYQIGLSIDSYDN